MATIFTQLTNFTPAWFLNYPEGEILHEMVKEQIILPSQFYGNKTQETGATRLALALLLISLKDIFPGNVAITRRRLANYKKKRQARDREDALRWIFVDDTDSVWPYTFAAVCEMLELSERHIRAAVTKLIATNGSGPIRFNIPEGGWGRNLLMRGRGKYATN
jgi:hypothetical protein